jgi:putative membrane-bound dehydrogenase-like protein
VGKFSLAEGFTLEQVAAEPLVSDPVDACFDAWGRMFVAEMHGYPFSQEPTKLNPAGGGKSDAGIVRMLEDTDGDGLYDKSTVFAQGISWPTSVCCFDGGVFVLAPKFLYYFKDTDGDGKADRREVILEGFGRDNVQSLTNNLKWGLDNKIYFAGGRNGGKILHRGKEIFSVGGGDIRFDPRTEEFELITGGQQFGHCMNDWGQRFVCSNSNHIQQVIFPRHYLARNPGLAAASPVRSIASDGASAPVFRTSPPEPWRIVRQKWRAEAKGYKLVIEKGAWKFIPLDPSKKPGAIPTEYPVGYFTSATGITIYRGGAYPKTYRGDAFVGDVGGNLVHRKTVKLNGVVYTAKRADQGSEFVRSPDNWFRPVNFVNAPDGSLYMLDMYRETVEHPYSIPDEIKKYLHLESGDDRGRIYRLVSPHMKRMKIPPLGDFSAVDLVAALESPNSWTRQTAQRLLWERQDHSVVKQLEQLAAGGSTDLGRLHALYTLDGLHSLSSNVLHSLVTYSNPRLREHVVRLSEHFLNDDSVLLDKVVRLADDPDARVRFQLAFSLGESQKLAATRGLARLVKSADNDRDIRTAILSSVADRADLLIAELLGDPDFLERSHAAAALSDLAVTVGSLPNQAMALRLLAGVVEARVSAKLQQIVLTSLGEGLSRRGSSISKLLNFDSSDPALRQRVNKSFKDASRIAGDSEQSLMIRMNAVGLLAFASFDSAKDTLAPLLSPQTPQLLQRAAVSALAQHDPEQAGTLLLQGWKTYSPSVRRDVTDAMLSSVIRIQLLLRAIKTQTIQRRDLDRDKIQVLLNHPNAKIKATSTKLFADAAKTDRADVVNAYQRVLDLQGDAQRGRQVFTKKCAICHRVGDIGFQVAPELASVQNKSPADLLLAILDPNREAQPNYNTYTVITNDGRIFNGIIANEGANSITIRRAEAKDDVVLRSNIDELIASGKSLMPEGLEKDLSQQDLADVISFIKSIKPKSRQ